MEPLCFPLYRRLLLTTSRDVASLFASTSFEPESTQPHKDGGQRGVPLPSQCSRVHSADKIELVTPCRDSPWLLFSLCFYSLPRLLLLYDARRAVLFFVEREQGMTRYVFNYMCKNFLVAYNVVGVKRKKSLASDLLPCSISESLFSASKN